MTKEQERIAPEDLYNLTQLAEVAASRLNTNNAYEFNNKYLALCYEKAREQAYQLPPTHQQHHQQLQYMPSHWRYQALDINEAAQFQKQYQELYPLTAAQSAEKLSDLTQSNKNFSSSSDDDCNYYSHKVFDRKKHRRYTLSSENSSCDLPRYDEHSCSSMPSCSSDEQQQQQQHNNLIKTATFMSTVAVVDNDKFNANNETSEGSMMNTAEDIHICSECGKKYSTSSNLARHRQTHRSIMDKKARRCPYCEKVYVSMPAFSMHVRTHNQGCECPFCGKCFSRPWLLQGHIRTHTGEKPFKCHICDKAFADKSNLRAHIQTHSNVKPHFCARCNKAFALKSYLYKHEESSCMKNTNRDDKKLRQLARAAANG